MNLKSKEKIVPARIHSVSEYLENIGGLKNFNGKVAGIIHHTFFRGQSNKDWNLNPGICRKDNLFYDEGTLLAEVRRNCPAEFTGDRFDFLVKMQHYGLPTRLLDVTTKPLVALYFACASNKENDSSDGMVYVFLDQYALPSTDPLIQVIMDYIYEYDHRKPTNLEKMYRSMEEKYGASIFKTRPTDSLSLRQHLKHTFPVLPAIRNPRITAQDGAFFLCGMDIESADSKFPGKTCVQFKPFEEYTPKVIAQNTDYYSLIIDASSKQDILQKLDVLGVNEAKLFPDLSHQIKHIVERFRASN